MRFRLLMFCPIGIVTYLLFSFLSLVVVGQTSDQMQTPFLEEHVGREGLELILDDEFEKWMNEIGYRWGMNGVAIAVTRRTKDANGEWSDQWVTESKGYGIADRWGHPVDEDTLFGIASNSKFFTALAIGILVQDEAYPINWDTKIKDILTDGEWVLQDPSMKQNATLVDILSHRTGLPRHDFSYDRTTDTPRSLVSKLRYLRPSAEFRDTYQYNNQMYTTAAYIVERVTNKTLQEFVAEKVFKPLGMNVSTYIYDDVMVGHGLADGFVAVESGHPEGQGRDKAIYKPTPFLNSRTNPSLNAGPGGIISNIKDVTRWLQTLLLTGRHPVTNEQIIPEEAISKASEGVSVETPSPKDPSVSPVLYGFGQTSFSYQGHYIVEHYGSTIGHETAISRAPHDGIGIAILTNTFPIAGPVLLDLVKWRLYEKALKLKYVDWESKVPDPKAASEITESKPLAPSTHPIDSYTGIYSNPAYGKIIICPFDLNKYTSSIQSSPYLPHCKAVVSEILQASSDGLTTNSRRQPDLVFSWDKYWSTHVLMSHLDNNTFSARPITIYPPPFPDSKDERDNKPFASDYPAPFLQDPRATFVVESEIDNKGISGPGLAVKGIWGAGNNVKEMEGTSKETAEVWFDRIGRL